MSNLPADDELTRHHHHRVAAMAVSVSLTLTLVLTVMAFLSNRLINSVRAYDPILIGVLRITILVFGLGAVALRRTRLATMRLQDIAGLRGEAGLLDTLQKTTVLLAVLGGAIAVMGFTITVLTGERFDMLSIGLIAIAVLFYSYPRRAAWQRIVQESRTRASVTNSPAEDPPAKGKIA